MASPDLAKNALSTLLEKRDWILADGATGTQLFNMGLSSGDAPEFWNELYPDRITRLYSEAVDAGSDLFLTNTFGANASRLKLHDAQDRAFDLSRMAAEIGRNVADKAGRPIVVAGSMGPTGELMEPMGNLTHEIAVEMFQEQAEGLKAGGADVVWAETISDPAELKAAAEAAKRAGMAWCDPLPLGPIAVSARLICCARFKALARPTSQSSPKAMRAFQNILTAIFTMTAHQT